MNGNPAQDSIDISLVEGYSVPVQCTAMGVTVGGTTDLFTLKATCNTLENGNCRNLKVGALRAKIPVLRLDTSHTDRYANYLVVGTHCKKLWRHR